MKKILIFTVLAAILTFSVAAQDSEQTVEEKYLTTSVEISIIT